MMYCKPWMFVILYATPLIFLYLTLSMRKKQNKIQIIPPFKVINDWELIHKIESSLNKYLGQPHIYTNVEPTEEAQRLGRHGIQQIIKFAKSLMQISQTLRAEQKNIEQIKLNAHIAHEKLQQHEEIVRNYEKKFNDRTKALVDENRMLKESIDKMKKTSNQNEQNLKTINEQIRQQSNHLRQQLSHEETEKKRLLVVINELQQEIKNKNQMIYRLKSSIEEEQKRIQLKDKVVKLQQIRIQSKKRQESFNAPKFNVSAIERISLIDISALAQLISFLIPKQICQLTVLNKQLRFLVLKSKQCVFELARSVKAVKDKQVAYYHNHISYFEKLCNKIPEQILQMTYFKYHILKDTIGSQIMGILNSSAVIFEGKFLEGGQGEQLYAGITQQAQKKIEVKFNTTEATLLEVDPQIVKEYINDSQTQRQKLVKLFEAMYNKISSTFQLYRADIESTTLFIENVLKHFSKVFILSKNLYFQAQNLQKLNIYLINELNKWDRMQIDKNLQLEDLRAELDAEKKLKLFFTDKSIKSEQKALIEQNLKLTFEMKYNKMSDLMNVICAQKEELQRKNETLAKFNEKMGLQNKQIRRLYESIRQKYNKITEELAVVKETIIKMNII